MSAEDIEYDDFKLFPTRESAIDWLQFYLSSDEINNLIKALSVEPCEDCISRKAVLDMVEDMTDQFGNKHRVVTEGMISLLSPVTPKPKTDVLDKIRAEIEYIGGDDEKAFCKNLNESYKQGLKDALKVIDKYKAESEE